jgi:hypothetical protein
MRFFVSLSQNEPIPVPGFLNNEKTNTFNAHAIRRKSAVNICALFASVRGIVVLPVTSQEAYGGQRKPLFLESSMPPFHSSSVGAVEESHTGTRNWPNL